MNENRTKKELLGIFETDKQKERKERNVEIVTYFTKLVNKNKTIKKTLCIKECANHFGLTYSTTRLILIKGGVYKSKI